MKLFSISDWYWSVDGDDRYWSSLAGGYVTSLPEGAGVTAIETEDRLAAVMASHGLPGPKVLPADVHAERDRRLAAGFDYDFGDARGVHLIRTTPGDMVGWDEVTKFAQALINAGQPTTLISIATGTGLVQLTAMEWQGVLIAAAAFRQPIWGASFILEAMNPIPADFREEAYWTPPAE